jgi:protein-S-isoprenylcysteine O-methyltransferase Ste14
MTIPALFRVAAPASGWRNFQKTLGQCAIIWTVFLVAVPWALVTIETRAGLERFTFSRQRILAAALLLGFSVLNLSASGFLSHRGHGTPLPVDCPRLLVVTGPYAHVRNPMAIAGLGQGLAVVLWLGSWFSLVYVALGVLAWQYVARPAEEADLTRRFGAAYDAYRSEIRCWWPRLIPYRVKPAGPKVVEVGDTTRRATLATPTDSGATSTVRSR